MRLLLFLFLFPTLGAMAQSSFERKIADAEKLLSCITPDEQTPVTLNAQLVQDGDSIAVILKVNLAPGWHIYEYVPASLPYIALDRTFQLPEHIRAVGEWRKTAAISSVNDPGVLIYEQEAIFVHKAVLPDKTKSGGTVQVGLYYQTCNLRQCLPPVEKTFDLKL